MYAYDSETLSALGRQLARVAEHELYERSFAAAGFDPDVESWDDFREAPLLTPGDLEEDYETNGPEGSLYRDAVMMSFTPLGDALAPVFDTRDDLRHQAEINANAFERAGVEPGDRVLNTFGYHTFGTGIVVHRGLEALGAEVIPAGPGDSEAAADTMDTYDVDALVGNPSYALKIAEAGGSARVFVGAGEPFTAVPGLRDAVTEALGADVAVDYFGTRQILPVAVETAAEDGLHVLDDYAVVEIIDPDTEEPLSAGERGELVVTHVRKEGVPLVRYRTGDLAELTVRGDDVVLPDGVIGRTDERLKVKGVKVYPESLELVLAGFDGLTGEYRLEVTRPASTDHVRLLVEGDADVDAVGDAVGDRLLVSPDEVEIVDELDGSGVVDERY